MTKRTISVAMAVGLCAVLAHAGTRADLSGDTIVDFATTMDMPFMAVGNLGNTDGPYDGGFGAVDYAYDMGKFEVTTGQYTEFLNAVAADDTYGLFNERMADPTFIDGDALPFGGSNIQRAGSAGSYTYSIAAGWEDRPVNYVSWGDVGRFANWLSNGMPTGAQDMTTTENGAYFMNGATDSTGLKAAIGTRQAPAGGERFYYMPSEDEWVKAAYHKDDGDTGNYFTYPTSSDTLPSYIADGGSVIDPDAGNVATYDGDAGIDGIGAPYYRTEAGEHENSDSPYGTFDMAGNIGEWTEGRSFGSFAIVRGGEFAYGTDGLVGTYRRIRSMTRESGDIGFRLTSIAADAGGVPGDLDGDGDVDADDIDLFCRGIWPEPDPFGDPRDFDGDGDVDEDDMIYLVETFVELQDGSGRLGSKRGDFNLDGLVNGTDLALMKTAFGQPGMGYADGNANCDALVDGTDLAILKTNFGFIAPPGGAVPEPVTIGLLSLGGLTLLRRRRR
ncbi:MAG TPA: PEP-CTERM sorting domain-containing protein [Phycisphaerae bacterium]|nr:PEP-CTERM sorting domain-containing protein [Phycisphaerae bacterium]HDZ44655.1 PEP-CTERM sorting domain-containing protein [Phycisphaerae bacterium]